MVWELSRPMPVEMFEENRRTRYSFPYAGKVLLTDPYLAAKHAIFHDEGFYSGKYPEIADVKILNKVLTRIVNETAKRIDSDIAMTESDFSQIL
jgi:hypothetical protein